MRVFASSFSEPVQALIDRHPHVRAIPHWRAWPWQVGRNDVSIVATIEPREVKWSVGLGRLMGHLLNVADVPDRCDFYMGGIVTNGSLKLAISTDGKAPILAKRMREWLEDVLPEDVESNLDELQALRRELKGDFAQKQATLQGADPTFPGSASVLRRSDQNGAGAEGASLSKFIRTSSRSTGQSLPSRGVAANRSTTSMPSTTRPNTVCSPSRWGAPPCRA